MSQTHAASKPAHGDTDENDSSACLREKARAINRAAHEANSQAKTAPKLAWGDLVPDLEERRRKSLDEINPSERLREIAQAVNTAALEANYALFESSLDRSHHYRPYVYPPLSKPENLRLILVYPGNGPAELSMFESPSSKNHPDFETYFTLSYTWGDATGRVPITINGYDFEVTNNLNDYLCSHRDPVHRTGPIWIDALCINQSDDTEKAVQVNMMNTIYRNCSRCVVWLGSEADDSASGMRLIRGVEFLVRHVYTRHILNYGCEKCRDKTNPTFMRALANCPIFAAVLRDMGVRVPGEVDILARGAWPAVFKLISRPWFRRIWTVQEFVLPAEVALLCGSECVMADAIIILDNALNLWIPSNGRSLPWYDLQTHNELHVTSEHRYGYHYRKERDDSWTNALRYREKQATVPQDRIFGLLGLSEPGIDEKKPFKANYKLTLQETYQDFAIHHYQHGDLERIFLWGGNRRGIPSVPSWVPDWEVDKEVTEFPNPWMFKGAGNSLRTIARHIGSHLRDHGRAIHHPGVIFDRVERMFEMERRYKKQAEAGKEHKTIRNLKILIAKQGLENGHYHPQNQSVFDILWRVLGCNIVYIDGQEKAASAATDWNQMDLRTAKRDVAPSKDFVYPVDYAAYDAGRKFFVTECGYLGLGPKDTRQGDVVCVFRSIGFPIMLRQIARRDAYEMLGTCYVQGIMDGEIAAAINAGQRAVEIIELR